MSIETVDVLYTTAKFNGLSQADAEKIVALGHQFCPYSKAVRGNVEVTVRTVVV